MVTFVAFCEREESPKHAVHNYQSDASGNEYKVIASSSTTPSSIAPNAVGMAGLGDAVIISSFAKDLMAGGLSGIIAKSIGI